MTENKQHFKEKDERFYETPYGKVPSVTTVLGLYDKSGPLMGWVAKVIVEYLKSLADKNGNILIKQEDAEAIFKKAKARHKELKEEAADLGVGVHNLVEVHLKGQPVKGLLEEEPRLVKPFEAFQGWQKQYKFELLASEKQVCSDLGFAGTLDCIARLNGKTYLIDFKSSNAIYETYFWQVAAYKECAERGKYFDGEKWVDSAYKIEGVGILRLGKENGLPEWREATLLDCVDYFDCFMCLCSLWRIVNRKKGEKNGL